MLRLVPSNRTVTADPDVGEDRRVRAEKALETEVFQVPWYAKRPSLSSNLVSEAACAGESATEKNRNPTMANKATMGKVRRRFLALEWTRLFISTSEGTARPD